MQHISKVLGAKKYISEPKRYEHNLGQLSLLDLLDALKEVEDIRKEFARRNKTARCRLMKFMDGTYRIVMDNVRVH